MNILVVDDEFYTCELLAEKIRSFGLREIEAVLCAGSGKEALRILEKTDCQLLITDICMSPMDGLELISKAKEIQPELICVLLSAFDEFAYAQRGIQLRIRDYWLKPVNEEEMRASLLEIIQNEELTEEAKKEAVSSMIALTETAQKESDAQMLLEAKGFTQTVVSISGDTADVMVEAANLTESQTAQILDIVQRKTNITPENIIITVSGASTVAGDAAEITGEITGEE